MLQRIYCLVDPRDDTIRYVGVTTMTLAKRLSMHKSSVTAGKHTNVYRWIGELRNLELEPEIRLIEETDDRTRETYWINLFKQRGMDLHNQDDGGGRNRQISDAERERRSKAHQGKPLSQAQRQAQSEGWRKRAANNQGNGQQQRGSDGAGAGPDNDYDPESDGNEREADSGERTNYDTRRDVRNLYRVSASTFRGISTEADPEIHALARRIEHADQLASVQVTPEAESTPSSPPLLALPPYIPEG